MAGALAVSSLTTTHLRRFTVIRVLTILAALVAFGATAVPASALEPTRVPRFVPVPYPNISATPAKRSGDVKVDYMIVVMEEATVTS
jgi:hypothetical protein